MKKSNQTSFLKGHKRSKESILKQSETLKKKIQSKEIIPQFKIGWTPSEEVIKKRKETRAKNCLGNRYLTKNRNQGFYWMIYTENGRVYEHRHLMSQKLGRVLERHEHVHHLNNNGLDNRIENLQLLTNSEHRKLHNKTASKETYLKIAEKNKLKQGEWSRKYLNCLHCQTTQRKHLSQGLCGTCYQAQRRKKSN